ncbi:acyl-CoA thioesterase [Ornithinicoccus hortensis]|uniref:Acyl-CoA thioesterase 2 n=1 Tax=Ornithinicoccus hortensis TaxID=82346 RepID=A0A542YUE9_9MICO|nr:acyl-CoA thioesterase II [Ornithinicoccus hortensis]TQL51712.1 acyl-CoA thioesterase-2 [Ornithinicoccus hortensis]
MNASLEDPVDDLLDVLDLSYEGSTTVRVSSTAGVVEDLRDSEGEVYVGRSQPMPTGRVFGGQVLAQCVVAAGRTVDVDDGDGPRLIHSLHGYFLRPGDANRPIRFLVDRMRDGGSFSARRVHAVQEGRILLSMIASFQESADGLDHQVPMPQVTAPEGLPSDAELLADVDHPAAQHAARRAVEMRHVDAPLYLGPDPDPRVDQSVWLRLPRTLPDDPLLHSAVLAYASDYSLLEPVLRRHGISWGDPRLRIASLDHAMWFHRPGRADEWILYTQRTPSAEGGRGLGQGHMFARDGTLLATVGQEGMVRLKG